MSHRNTEGLIGVEYSKLFKLLHKKKIPKTYLKEAGIDRNIVAKLSKDEYVAIQSIEKIARFLGCDIGDIVSIRKDDYKDPNEHEAIVKKIAIDELEALLFGEDA